MQLHAGCCCDIKFYYFLKRFFLFYLWFFIVFVKLKIPPNFPPIFHIRYQKQFACYMNIGDTPDLIFEQQGKRRNVVDEKFYQLILNEAGL